MYKIKSLPTEQIVLEGGTPQFPDPENMTNVSYLAPDLLPYLLPGEKIINVEEIPRRYIKELPSSLFQLMRLTNVTSSEAIGDNGPVFAATSLNKKDTRSDLHLYEAVFGRDSLFVANELLDKYPKLARATLIKLASMQGTKRNDAREEEPGRIPHEIRDPDTDKVAQSLSKERGWDWPYYGSVDATPEFLRVLSNYCLNVENGSEILNEEFTMLDGTTRKMSEAAEAALDWVHRRTQANDEGFIEYKSVIPNGIENQVWRDSWDAYFHADGTLANSEKGIASVDVQRITYDALEGMAKLYSTMPHKQGESNLLFIQAALLRKKIFEHFWVEKDGGFFALGIDRDESGSLRRLEVKTSDMGHLLNSSLLEGNEPEVVQMRGSVIRQLFSPEMMTPWGIRTLASDEVRYRPGAYHNGSVWLWYNYLISRGLRRHQYNELANELDDCIMRDTRETRELPEYIRGDVGNRPEINTRIVDVWDSVNKRVNRIEQPPQEVQAWSVAAVLAIKIRQGNKDYKYHKPVAYGKKIIKLLPIAS